MFRFDCVEGGEKGRSQKNSLTQKERFARDWHLRSASKQFSVTLVQNKFLKCLRLVSRMGSSSTPVCGVATPCHPQAGGIVW
jgi:hypothetical protein